MGAGTMTRKTASIISILAFVALLRPCAHLWQFMELLAARSLGVGYDAMPTTRFLEATYHAFGIVAASLANWAIGLSIAAIPAILLYRFLVRRDFDGVCKYCASRKILSWSMFSLFVLFSLVQPQLILRPWAGDSEPLPLDDAMAQTPPASLELCLCHPDSDKLVGELRGDGELTEEALASAGVIDGYRLMPLMRNGKLSDACYVSATVELSNCDLQSAAVQEDFMHRGRYGVCGKLNREGAGKFRKLTEDYAPEGKKNPDGALRRLAIVIDGRLVAAPAIREGIDGGKFTIAGDLSAYEAMTIAVGLTPRETDD